MGEVLRDYLLREDFRLGYLGCTAWSASDIFILITGTEPTDDGRDGFSSLSLYEEVVALGHLP
jgi:hypothetical protein